MLSGALFTAACRMHHRLAAGKIADEIPGVFDRLRETAATCAMG
jgi:hypothetical protein